MPNKTITAVQIKFNEQSRLRPEAREPLQAFAIRVESNRKAMMSYARNLTKNSFDAEDIVQNTIYRAIKGYSKFSEQNLTGWLMHMLKWEFLNLCRERKQNIINYVGEVYETTCKQTVENKASDNSKFADMEYAVNALEQKDRTIAEMKFLRGMKYRDIAVMLDMPLGTVKSRLYYIRKVLVKQLNEYEK